MVDDVQDRGLHKLRFHDRRDDLYDRFSGKDHSSFRDGIDIAGETEGAEIFQEILLKDVKPSQIINILFGKMKIFYIFNHLLQPGGNGETAAAGVGAVKHIEDDSLVCGVFEIPLHHGQFIEIREQGQVCCSHVGSPSCILHDFYKFIILKPYVNYSIKNPAFQYFHAMNSKISGAHTLQFSCLKTEKNEKKDLHFPGEYYIIPLVASEKRIQGYRQMVRQRTLTPSFQGSNPCSPAE